MKLLVTSDWHLDAVTAGLSRRGEVVRYVDALVEVARSEKVDHWLFLGDAFDPGHLDEANYAACFTELALKLADACPGHGFVLVGNHDVHEAERPLSVLTPLRVACEGAGCIPDKTAPLSCIAVMEWPCCYRSGFDADGASVSVLALPYVSRAYQRTEAYRVAYDKALSRAREDKEAGLPLVVASHLSLPGMTPGSEAEMPRGRDVMFPAADVAALGPDVVVQGHYHARQTVRLPEGLDVEVVGAPLRFTFGERADGERGYLLLEVSKKEGICRSKS